MRNNEDCSLSRVHTWRLDNGHTLTNNPIVREVHSNLSVAVDERETSRPRGRSKGRKTGLGRVIVCVSRPPADKWLCLQWMWPSYEHRRDCAVMVRNVYIMEKILSRPEIRLTGWSQPTSSILENDAPFPLYSRRKHPLDSTLKPPLSPLQGYPHARDNLA